MSSATSWNQSNEVITFLQLQVIFSLNWNCTSVLSYAPHLEEESCILISSCFATLLYYFLTFVYNKLYKNISRCLKCFTSWLVHSLLYSWQFYSPFASFLIGLFEQNHSSKIWSFCSQFLDFLGGWLAKEVSCCLKSFKKMQLPSKNNTDSLLLMAIRHFWMPITGSW